jgi:hypothetical protein
MGESCRPENTRKGNLKVFSKGGLSKYIGLLPVLGISFSGEQLKRDCSLINRHNTLRKYPHGMDFMMFSHAGVENNMSGLFTYYTSVML